MAKRESARLREETTELRSIGDCDEKCETNRRAIYRTIDKRFLYILALIGSVVVLGWGYISGVNDDVITLKAKTDYMKEKVDHIYTEQKMIPEKLDKLKDELKEAIRDAR